MSLGTAEVDIGLVGRLNGITARFSHVVDLDTLAREVQSIIDSVAPVEYSGLYLYDPVAQTFRLPVAKGFSEEERKEAERTAWDRHPGRVVRDQQIIHVADTATDDSTTSSRRGFVVRSRLWLPVMSRGECVGAFGLASGTPRTFTDEHIAMMQYVANMAGLVYSNLIDRRALLVAGLSYFAIAVWNLIPGDSVLGDNRFAVTAMILGGFLLSLGLGWHPIRRVALALLPGERVRRLFPPVD